MYLEGQPHSINPAFAGHLSDRLREASGELHRVFDNLLQIARGQDPTANGHDRLRATGILYDRGFGKVIKNQAQAATRDRQPRQTPVKAAAAERPVARLEQKLDDSIGSAQAPAQPDKAGESAPVPAQEPALTAAKATDLTPHKQAGLPAPPIDTPNYTPDLVRDSQYYVLEITNYGEELVSILMNIHEPDPDDTTIRACHRITAGQMIFDRVIGPVPDFDQPIDHWHDPSVDPKWVFMHPADIDSDATPEQLMKAERDARDLFEDFLQEAAECDRCTADAQCEEHQEDDDDYDLLMIARSHRNLAITADRLYYDPDSGRLRLNHPDHVDDS